MTLAIHPRMCQQIRKHRVEVAACHGIRSTRFAFGTNVHRKTLFLLTLALLAGFPLIAGSQALPSTEDSSSTLAGALSVGSKPVYSRPTEKAKFRNYVFDAFGPIPFVSAGFAAGISQATNTPPEWHQGAEGYGKRFGSDLGIAMVSTTTRYALSEAFKEDALYYRCECRGAFPRLRYAALTTLIARRGQDGHRVFSVPALIAPYAGSMTAVYGWYPDRYTAKDGFRMGNYSLLAHVGGNIAREFLYSEAHSLLSRIHFGKSRSSPGVGPTE